MKTSKKLKLANSILLILLIFILSTTIIFAGNNGDHFIMSLDKQNSRNLSFRSPVDYPYSSLSLMTPNNGGASSYSLSQSFLYEGYNHYEVKMNNLLSGKYEYTLDNDTTNNYTFDVLPSSNNFEFLFFGDVQEGYVEFGELVTNAYRKFPKAEFGLMAGDMVNYGFSSTSWEEFLEQAEKVFNRIPMMSAIGNHEISIYSMEEGRKPKMYLDTMVLPENGPDGFKEEFYSFDYNNIHVTVLSSNYANPNESFVSVADEKKVNDWIQNDLSSSSKPWKFILMHHPVYPVTSDITTDYIKENWLPIFEKNNVDVVFCGHQHEFVRTKEINGLTQIMGNSGTKYYTENPTPLSYIAFEKGNTSGYHRINVSGSTLTIDAYNSAGVKIDSWTKHQPNLSKIQKILVRNFCKRFII